MPRINNLKSVQKKKSATIIFLKNLHIMYLLRNCKAFGRIYASYQQLKLALVLLFSWASTLNCQNIEATTSIALIDVQWLGSITKKVIMIMITMTHLNDFDTVTL